MKKRGAALNRFRGQVVKNKGAGRLHRGATPSGCSVRAFMAPFVKLLDAQESFFIFGGAVEGSYWKGCVCPQYSAFTEVVVLDRGGRSVDRCDEMLKWSRHFVLYDHMFFKHSPRAASVWPEVSFTSILTKCSHKQMSKLNRWIGLIPPPSLTYHTFHTRTWILPKGRGNMARRCNRSREVRSQTFWHLK